ncbi:MAG: hypothetical protein LBP86_08930 [Azoarcus sp.]|jgi:uncharacterized membrane protein HdeD (DUF308 family)|nr:hypothetical protein [Azoarcus sp.]
MKAKLKHLEMIQDVINRMAGNSFQLKGWSVTVLSALLALVAGSNRLVFVLPVALFPCVAFWVLDGFFLHQERLYRALYNDVANKDAANITFSMNTSAYTDEAGSWLGACLSRTLLIFHGILLLGTIATSTVIVFYFVGS